MCGGGCLLLFSLSSLGSCRKQRGKGTQAGQQQPYEGPGSEHRWALAAVLLGFGGLEDTVCSVCPTVEGTHKARPARVLLNAEGSQSLPTLCPLRGLATLAPGSMSRPLHAQKYVDVSSFVVPDLQLADPGTRPASPTPLHRPHPEGQWPARLCPN